MATFNSTSTNFSKHFDAAWCVGMPNGNVIADSNYITPKHEFRVFEGVGPRIN
jgi:hypothetical protein